MMSAHANEIPTRSKRSCNAFGVVYPRCASVNGCILYMSTTTNVNQVLHEIGSVCYSCQLPLCSDNAVVVDSATPAQRFLILS